MQGKSSTFDSKVRDSVGIEMPLCFEQILSFKYESMRALEKRFMHAVQHSRVGKKSQMLHLLATPSTQTLPPESLISFSALH